MDVSYIERFLREKYLQELEKAVQEDRALLVDFSSLDRFDPVTGDQLLEDPEKTLKAFGSAAQNILDQKINVRFRNLPESRTLNPENVGARHLDRLWSIEDKVESTEKQYFTKEIVFECPECSTKLTVPQDSNVLQKPSQCECGRRGDFTKITKHIIDRRIYECSKCDFPFILDGAVSVSKEAKMIRPGDIVRFIGILKATSGRQENTVNVLFNVNSVERLKHENIDNRPLTEKETEDYLFKHPHIIEEGMISVDRQVRISSGIVDMWLKDGSGKHVIVELKAPDSDMSKKGKNVPQLFRYIGPFVEQYGKENSFDSKLLRQMLICFQGDVPDHLMETCQEHGIEVKCLPRSVIDLIKMDKGMDPYEAQESKPDDLEVVKDYLMNGRDMYSSIDSDALRLYHKIVNVGKLNVSFKQFMELFKDMRHQANIETENQIMLTDQRKELGQVIEIIDSLQMQSSSKEIALNDIRAEAENLGINDVDRAIARLLRNGVVFEPRPGFVRKI